MPDKKWDKKYYREQPFMAFGSMMNAYARMNQGQGVDMKKFLEDTDKMFGKALDYVNQANKFSEAD